MFLRVSIFTSILSVTVSGAFLQSSSADWYGIEIRSKEQAAMEAAEKKSADKNLPQSVWFETEETSAEETPDFESKKATSVTTSSSEVTTNIADNIWQATSPEVAAVTEDTASESFVPPAPAIDKEIADDVDTLLNQKEDWFAPIPGAEEASQKLETVAFEEETDIASSMTYLDELRELEEKESSWIQSSVVTSSTEMNAEFTAENALLTTQPMYVSELEEMAARVQSDPAGFMVNVSEGRLLSQADGDDNYSPVPASPADDQADEMESLFPPLSKISVTGVSTTPREAEINKYPENLAKAHMESLIPGKYVMGPVVGVAAPSRYPLCFQHNPLYFEDPNLERCGVSHGCFTTTVSAARFLGTTLALPYLVIATPPRTCMATLGDCPTCASFDSDAYFREWKCNR